MEIKKIDHLLERLDLEYFGDTEKAKLYAKLLLEVLSEIDPNIRQLLFHDIKLQYQEAMRRGIKVYHSDFERRCFELRDRADRIVLETKCLNCDSYFLTDWSIMHYIRRSNLTPHIPLYGVKCSECNHNNCIIVP